MAKYWVTLVKFAGVEVEADSEAEAEDKAYCTPESEYEFPQNIGDSWSLDAVNLVEED